MTENDSQAQIAALDILIVDDSPSDRTIFRRFLKQNGAASYKFTEAENITACDFEVQIFDRGHAFAAKVFRENFPQTRGA